MVPPRGAGVRLPPAPARITADAHGGPLAGFARLRETPPAPTRPGGALPTLRPHPHARRHPDPAADSHRPSHPSPRAEAVRPAASDTPGAAARPTRSAPPRSTPSRPQPPPPRWDGDRRGRVSAPRGAAVLALLAAAACSGDERPPGWRPGRRGWRVPSRRPRRRRRAPGDTGDTAARAGACPPRRRWRRAACRRRLDQAGLVPSSRLGARAAGTPFFSVPATRFILVRGAIHAFIYDDTTRLARDVAAFGPPRASSRAVGASPGRCRRPSSGRPISWPSCSPRTSTRSSACAWRSRPGRRSAIRDGLARPRALFAQSATEGAGRAAFAASRCETLRFGCSSLHGVATLPASPPAVSGRPPVVPSRILPCLDPRYPARAPPCVR
jgi:hypothetical protein